MHILQKIFEITSLFIPGIQNSYQTFKVTIFALFNKAKFIVENVRVNLE